MPSIPPRLVQNRRTESADFVVAAAFLLLYGYLRFLRPEGDRHSNLWLSNTCGTVTSPAELHFLPGRVRVRRALRLRDRQDSAAWASQRSRSNLYQIRALPAPRGGAN